VFVIICLFATSSGELKIFIITCSSGCQWLSTALSPPTKRRSAVVVLVFSILASGIKY